MYHYSLSYATIGNLEHLKLIFPNLQPTKALIACVATQAKALQNAFTRMKKAFWFY